MPQVFICFAAKDKPIADYFAALLRKQGVTVLFVQAPMSSFDFAEYDTGILILNPETRHSKWAMFGTAQAMLQHKPIITIETAAVNLLQFPFVIPSPPLDFAEPDNYRDAINQLFSRLDLEQPTDQIDTLPEPDDTIQEQSLTYEDEAVQQLFFHAVELTYTHLFDSLFLFEALLAIDPQYAKGQAAHYVAQIKNQLKPQLINEVQVQCEAAINNKQIKRAESCISLLRQLQAAEVESYASRVARLKLIMLHNATKKSIQQAAWDTVAEQITAIVAMDSDVLHEAVVEMVSEVTRLLLEKGQIEYAKTIANKLISLSDNRASREMLETILQQQIAPLIAQGEQAMTQRQGQDALAYAEQALKIQADDKQALELKGRAQAFIEAEAMYEQAKIAKQSGRMDAMGYLLLYVSQRSSEFGDPDDLATGQPIHPGFVGQLWELGFLEIPGGVNCMAMNGEGTLFVTGSRDKFVTVWTLPDCGEVTSFNAGNPVRQVAISPDGQFVAAVSGIADMKVWEVATGRELFSSLRTRSVTFSRDSQHFVIGQSSGEIHLHPISNPQTVNVLRGHNDDAVEDLAFSADGRYLASASTDYTVILWDWSQMKRKRDQNVDVPYRQLQGHPYHVRSVQFNSDASLLYAASEHIFIWDVETGERKAVIQRKGNAAKITLSAQGTILAVRYIGVDGAVLFRADTGAALRTLTEHESMVTDMLFAPDDSYLMTSTTDGIVRFWGLGKGDD